LSITLACTWRPRGQLVRFQRLYPVIAALYSDVVIALLANERDILRALQEYPRVIVVQPSDISTGRHLAIYTAAQHSGDFIHYIDLDRMLRWLETQPEEMREIINLIPRYDCLIIGRTPDAFATHAQALQQTESIVNEVVSFLLGQPVDTGGGSRGFSRQAVRFLQQHSTLGNAIGTDAEWPILLQRGGFTVGYQAARGLTWEVPDHYKAHAVDPESQQTAAAAYDQDATRWEMRIKTARNIIDAALAAAQKTLPTQ
jgi:hypothetical protein